MNLMAFLVGFAYFISSASVLVGGTAFIISYPYPLLHKGDDYDVDVHRRKRAIAIIGGVYVFLGTLMRLCAGAPGTE